MKPTNLSQLKEYLKPGMDLSLTIAPHLVNMEPKSRKVMAVNSVGFTASGDGIDLAIHKTGSEFTWGKACDYTFDEKGFQKNMHGQVLRYEYV